MSNYRNLKDIQNELNKRIRENEAKLELWNNVEFLTKKDGTAFKVMSKNFKNANYTTEPYHMRDCENILRVHGRINNAYYDDEIRCYGAAKNLKGAKEKVQNIFKHPYMEDLYKYDLDDIKEAIEERKQYLINDIKSLEEQLSQAEEIYNNVMKLHNQTMEYLRSETKDNDKGHNSLYYMLRDIINYK